jgi:hypothetical protein
MFCIMVHSYMEPLLVQRELIFDLFYYSLMEYIECQQPTMQFHV